MSTRARRDGVAPQRFVDVARAEWLKLRSVRSSWVTLLVTVALTIGLSALLCLAFERRAGQLAPGDRARFDPAFLSVSGIFLAQVSIGVLGVLVMSAEHTTGMIRSSLAAVPRRLRLLAAKVSVFLVVSLVVGVATSLVSFEVGQAIFSGHTIDNLFGVPTPMATTLGAPGSWRVVVGAGAYLGAVGLIGLGLGTLVRRTAGALAALFAIILVLPLIVSALPSPWSEDITKYLPGTQGNALIHVRYTADVLGAGAAAWVLAGYVAVVLLLGAVLLVRRDA